MTTSTPNVLFLTTPSQGSIPAPGFSDAFYHAIKINEIQVLNEEVFYPDGSFDTGAFGTSLRHASGSARKVDAVVSFAPIPGCESRLLRDTYKDAKIVTYLDHPHAFGSFEPLVEKSDAVVVAHSSYETLIDRDHRGGPAHERLKQLLRAGLMFAVQPGIDLDKFNPASDKFLGIYGKKFCIEIPQCTDRFYGPSGKQENYPAFRRQFGLPDDSKIENMVIAADTIAGHEETFWKSFTRFPKTLSAVFFGSDPLASKSLDKLITSINQRAGCNMSSYFGSNDELGARLLLAGSGYAVFFGNSNLLDYPDAATVRSILLFMRYGTMPIVPKIFSDMDIVEQCVVPRGQEKEDWLYPEGFGFVHDGSVESLTTAIGKASMHEYRTQRRRGLFSGAVPNAIQAAARHDIMNEGKAFAAALRKIIG